MATALTLQVGRPATMQSLLPRVAEQIRSVTVSHVRTDRGIIRSPVLPPSLVPSAAEKAALTRYADDVDKALKETPAAKGEYEAKSLAILTKLFLAKPSRATNELGAAARDESYAVAVEDVAWWAVQAAIQRWYRGECGEHDYRWSPDTVTLRFWAQVEEREMRNRANQFRRVAVALPAPPEPTKEEREAFAAQVQELIASIRASNSAFGDGRPEPDGQHRERWERVMADLEARKRAKQTTQAGAGQGQG